MIEPDFHLSLAQGPDDIRAAQRLRYDVFIAELGGDGSDVDHGAGIERDRFDPHADHLILRDMGRAPGDRVVGVYRLLTDAAAARAGGFYGGAEYDLAPLVATGRPLLELGRSCVHPAYRDGAAMFRLWTGLSDYVTRNRIEILFGVASFHGTDPATLAAPLSILHHRHLAPPDLRVVARSPHAVSMNICAPDSIDRPAAMRAVPSLIKAYLRLGGCVGEGAFVDHAFNTIDVCLILDTARMTPTQRAAYARRPG